MQSSPAKKNSHFSMRLTDVIQEDLDELASMTCQNKSDLMRTIVFMTLKDGLDAAALRIIQFLRQLDLS